MLLAAETPDLMGSSQPVSCLKIEHIAMLSQQRSGSFGHQSENIELVQMAAFGDPVAALKWVERQPFLPDIVFLGTSHSPA